jgi:lipopolysaccharide export system permease protein
VKTLDRYLLRQVLASLAMTVVVFTFVLLLGNLLKELLPLLVNRQVSMGLLAEAVGLLIPFVAAFALPIGMLTATLLVFGRFSADQELTAARASGLSLVSMILPILMLSLALCGVSAWVNMEVAPRCRVAYNNLRFNVQAELFSQLQLPENRPITEFPGHILYLGKNRKHMLQDVVVINLQNETNISQTVRAPRGQIETDPKNHRLILHLYDAVLYDVGSGMPISTREMAVELNLSGAKRTAGKPAITDLTFAQLQAELKDLENRIRLPAIETNTSPADLRRQKRELEKVRADITEQIRVQIHREVAFSFACFSFTLIGIPLGIRLHRRETNVGIAVALGLVAIYYALILLASSQANRADLAPHLWIWLPNFLFQAVGTVLLWRANRGF